MEACGSGINYVCIIIYMLIASYYFPGKIDCSTLYIYRCQTIDMDINPKLWKNNEDFESLKKDYSLFFQVHGKIKDIL